MADFDTEYARLQHERDVAFLTRKVDPLRWQQAKTAYAEYRSALRLLDAHRGGPGSPQPQTAVVQAEAP